MTKQVDAAVAEFQQGFSCSQAVLAAFGETLALEPALAHRLAAGFGAGMGRMAQTCGAVTGAYMVIGLKYGATSPQDAAAKEKTYRLVREFTERFQARNHAVSCRDLLGCDISTPAGFEQAKQQGLIKTVCPKAVKDAAEILEELL